MSFDKIDQTTFDQGLYGEPQKPRGWWSRNWKWFVPTFLLIMILLCSGCVTAIIFMIIGGMRHTEPYLSTMQKIQADPQVQEAFGQPIRDDSWMPIPTPDGNNIDMRWDLAGPKGKGKAYVKARMIDNKFEIVVIEVTSPDGKRIVLHEEGGNEAPPFQPQGAAQPEKKEETAPPPDLTPKIPMPEQTEPGK
jgi:hypothetical protein